jgi:hypothetical protein
MSMHTTRLTTHWNVAEAATAIEFLDLLRDALWQTYGEQIDAMHREAHDQAKHESQQVELELDDEIPF